MVEELSDGRIVGSFEEFSHRGVITRIVEELSHGNVIALSIKLLPCEFQINIDVKVKFRWVGILPPVVVHIALLQELRDHSLHVLSHCDVVHSLL